MASGILNRSNLVEEMISCRLEIPNIGIAFEADRLRREKHELHGELTVRCSLPGARTVNGCLVTGDFNFSSVTARQTRAKLLQQRAGSNGQIDWYAHLEEFCQGVFEREREGDPAEDIWEIQAPPKEDDFAVDGLAFPRSHPSILFGDGGSAKSYIALYIAGRLALQGVPVALFDWELSGGEHRDRFESLFRDQRPKLTYCRCERPLTSEVDRLARVIRERKIVYAFFDSISFACDGRPEDADTAARYFQAIRSLNVGSLHVAHVNKSEEADKKPFGSAFWHNGARATWYVKADPGDARLDLGFYHRKSNLGPLRHPVALRIAFHKHDTIIERISMSDNADLAEKMSVRQRMVELLGRGSMTFMEIAEQLDEKVDTVRKAVKRGNTFVVINGRSGEQDKVGLRARAI